MAAALLDTYRGDSVQGWPEPSFSQGKDHGARSGWVPGYRILDEVIGVATIGVVAFEAVLRTDQPDPREFLQGVTYS